MNVEVVGRIRPSIRAEGSESLVVEGQRIAAKSGGPFVNLTNLHRKDATNYDIYKQSVDDLSDLHMAGFNVCLLVMGESESGKTFTIQGESTHKAGLVPLILDYLFSKLTGDQYMTDTKVRRQNPHVTMSMIEVYNELVKDLLQVPGSGGAYLDIHETAEKGVHVKNCGVAVLRDASDGHAQFRQGMARRTEAATDFGPATRHAATIIHIDLEMIKHRKLVGDNLKPNHSRFTIVELPGLEKLNEDAAHLRQREGPTLSRALIGLNSLVISLASNPYADRVISYSDSKLTQLLREELGGNCKTRALLNIKPQPDPSTFNAIVQFTIRLSQVKNFPIINDSYAQELITQYRARIIDLKQQSGVGPAPMTQISNLNDVKETIRQLEVENLRLKDDNERLKTRLDGMQNKFGSMAHTKTDLSQQLLMTEEEKLKVSQSLVEMQIENNKIREEAEATKFELTNKILMLENSLLEAENERDKNYKGTRNARERLLEMEKDRKDLADEYVVLKTNYLALVREHEKEAKRNDELSIELLNLVNAKAALMKQIHTLADNDPDVGDPEAEVSRVKALVIKNSSGKVKADEILGSQTDRSQVENTLFNNKKRYERDMDRLKKEHGDDRQKLEAKLLAVQKELQESRNLARERQRRLAELNAALIVARGEKEQLELQLNRLQHKVKDLGEDYRGRLIKYVEDISEFVDKNNAGPDGRNSARMRDYVENMHKDISRSHKEREEQLSIAAQQYRESKRSLLHKYEELLIHYRNLRLQCEERGLDDIDMGPDETELKLSDSEINSSNLREITRLKGEVNRLKQTVDNYKNKFGVSDVEDLRMRPGEKPAETWAALRKQLREYTLNTQRDLEEERAKLMSENIVLKEQLKESQDYIDHHLVRYKQEIVKLRKMLGYDTNGSPVLGAPSYRRGRRK
ncbi:coiled-coil domain-containing protein 78-like isoform X3 [Ostrea edulis]|uniref:coiled-coil domain-containing protein 78-like isoform X3 n=1 Tax=Ostrea edulis TaxID=37623 RepID=UPI002094090C|nr:coiled-coil domain-containing protein 78-like isoform X3 [Ostrea edulis]